MTRYTVRHAARALPFAMQHTHKLMRATHAPILHDALGVQHQWRGRVQEEEEIHDKLTTCRLHKPKQIDLPESVRGRVTHCVRARAASAVRFFSSFILWESGMVYRYFWYAYHF